MAAEIPLGGKHARGRVALVDDADVPLVTGYRWRVWEQARADGTLGGPYAVAKMATGHRGGRLVYMHALITGWPRTDHENGNGLDNTRRNLRQCDQSHNLANTGKRRTGGTSRYKGVSLHRSGRWRARIKVNREQRTIGLFADEEEAARAYDTAAAAAWGPFARLNFPAG